MADAPEIAELRRLIDEPTQDPFTDVMLSARIDAADDMRVLASQIWREKAASYAGLVDVREGNSDRKLSQLYTQALGMASNLSGGADLPTGRPTRTRQIERQ